MTASWFNDGLGSPAIEFLDVSYSTPLSMPLLAHFSLTVNTGEVLALVGRSGAGKTTILKLINRILTPASGRILVDGRDTRDWDVVRLRRSIGYVIQDVGLFPHLTVADNIAVVPRLEHWNPLRVSARIIELMALVNLPPARFAERWPDELSGGQRQRVGVARALAADPAIILMDEPFGALDPVTRKELRDEFSRIQARVRKTVVIVTHDMSEALALADRIAVLDEGSLIACDEAGAMFDSVEPRVRSLLDAGIFSKERWLVGRMAK